MSKKAGIRVWSRNLLQSNLNNKPIPHRLKSQQSLEIQQSEQQKESNFRRKLQKTVNTNKRYVTSKDKFRGHNCVPNNITRLTPTTRRNVTRTLHFNANSLWHKDGAQQPIQNQEFKEFKYSKDWQNNNKSDSHNLHRNCKCSLKLLNVPNPQRQQYRKFQKNHTLQLCHHFGKNNAHKSFNTAYTNQSPSILPCNRKDKCVSNVHVVLPKLDNNNNCQRLHLCGGEENPLKMLQWHGVTPGVTSSLTQLTRLPQVPQYQELLLGMFEVLPPLFLLKSSTCEIIKPDAKPKYQHQKPCLFEVMKHQSHGYAISAKPKMQQPLHERRVEHNNLKYGRVLKYLHSKSKPSDRDVVFGNAYSLLSRHYGWETSRIEWLLKLEREHLNHTKRKLNFK